MINTTSIASKVQDQFPSFYKEYGQSFIDFVTVYYKWLENNKYTGVSKGILSSLDIDETSSTFLEYFKNEYMNNISPSILGNQKYLQKHILDLYRSKGSDAGIKLLFRLLYNKDVDIYIPGNDVFKLSDGKWIQRKYFELDDREINSSFVGFMIYGEVSKASALVESYEIIPYNGINNCIMWISNITGNFLKNERIYNDILNVNQSPRILGSAIDFEIQDSNIEIELGSEFHSLNDNNLKYNIKTLSPEERIGIVIPVINNGGFGYSVEDTAFTYTKFSNTSPGTGLSLVVDTIINPTSISITDVKIASYANTLLSANNYGMPGLPVTNTSSIIGPSLEFQSKTIGTIASLRYINPGINYDNTVTINALDEQIYRMELYSNTYPGILGGNADIKGYPSYGKNQATDIVLKNSSFGYHEDAVITLEETNGVKRIIGKIITGAIGSLEGYYLDNSGFLSNTKYIIDSNYYQEYSYDIKTDEIFSEYFSILKKTVHPAGKKVFGNPVVTSEINTNIEIESQIQVN